MKSRSYWAALLLCVLALGAKITAFVFAPALLLAIWWQTGRLRWRKDVLPTLPFFAVTLALGLLISWLEVYHVGAEGREFSASLSERLISTGRAFWFYPWKLLWPVDLCFIYPDWRTFPLGAAGLALALEHPCFPSDPLAVAGSNRPRSACSGPFLSRSCDSRLGDAECLWGRFRPGLGSLGLRAFRGRFDFRGSRFSPIRG